MIRLTFLLVLTSFLSLQGTAQHSHERGVCGTNEIDIERTKANIAYAKANPLQSRSITYVPIRFHLFGEDDGSGAVSPNNIIDLMAAINVDFAPFDMQFFLEDSNGEVWDYTFNDELFNDHAAFQPFLRNVRQRITDNAVLVFIPNTATPPNSNTPGTTLGYYSTREDYLVFKKSEVSNNASTASHEIGHYFSLPHTFRGWDCTTWDGTTNEFLASPVVELTAPCSDVPVELVSRGSDGNCEIAGDLFCDTPADYNLGFGWSDCNYTGGVRDATETLLEPAENNFMGYFIGCNPYEFSQEQIATMNADLASNDRSFLRNQMPTTTEAITDAVVLVEPLDGTTTPFSDEVLLDWDRVEHAKYYYVEVSESRSFRQNDLTFDGVLNSSSVLVPNLTANTTYYYRVRAFSQSSFGDYGTTTRFITGTVSSVNAQPQAVESMTLYPNPTLTGGATTLKLESSIGGEVTLTIRDLTGRTLGSSVQQILVGDNSINLIGLIPSVKGSYTLSVSNAKGISSQKFEVL